MDNEQTPALREAVENMVTMRQVYDSLSQAAEAYNVGKAQLAENITSKGVSASASETLPELAEKVSAISQETYEINGGEMYAKQLFGSLETPNYWNLYEVMAQLLSDGRLVSYGGILLAEYYKGYDSLALSGAGAGGAYVVSDMENGQFKMYTNDIIHVWNTEDDGKCDRWVAYCFANEGHDFEITNTNTSPRKIHIGRKVGNLIFLANSRTSEIIITDGAELADISQGSYTSEWAKQLVILGLKNHTNKVIASSSEQVYIKVAGKIGNLYSGSIVLSNTCNSIYIEADEIEGGATSNSYYVTDIPTGIVRINTPKLTNMIVSRCKKAYFYGLEECSFSTGVGQTIFSNVDYTTEYIYIGYSTNDKAKRVNFAYGQNNEIDIELQEGYCKSIGFYSYNASNFINLTESGMIAHILRKLKQDQPNCGDGVTITLGSTNLAKLTSAESVALLDSLTNVYGYTFA